MTRRFPELATKERWAQLLLGLLLLILVVRAGLFLAYSLRTLLFPFPVDYDEGVILHTSLLLAHGQAIYPPLAADRFVSSAYTPLFYVLTAPVLRLTGASLLPGRLLAWLSAVGCFLLLAGLARLLGSGRLGALLVALLPLGFGTTIVWSTLAKPDLPALCCALLTLYWTVRFRDSRWVYLAALWFALGFFLKQNTPLLAGAALLYLLCHHPRRGLLLGVLAAGLTAGPFLLLNALTAGNLVLHTVGFHQLPWQWSHLWEMAEVVLVFLPGLVLLALLAMFLLGRRRAFRPALFFFLGSLLLLLTGGRVGTNWSFHLPLLLAMSLAAGLLLWPPAAPAVSPRLYFALLVVAVLQFALIPNPLAWYNPDLLASPARQEALEKACAILRQTPPEILSEDVGMLLLCGHEPRYDDPFMMAQLARAVRWDDGVLAGEIAAARFTRVVLAYDLRTFYPERPELLRWTAAPLSALRRHYSLEQELGGLFLYRPAAAGEDGP